MTRRKIRRNAETFGYRFYPSGARATPAKGFGPHEAVVEVSLPWIKERPSRGSSYAHMEYGGENGIEIRLVKGQAYVGGDGSRDHHHDEENLQPAWFLLIRDEIMAVIPDMSLEEAIEQTPELLAMALLDKILLMDATHGVTLRDLFKTDDGE